MLERADISGNYAYYNGSVVPVDLAYEGGGDFDPALVCGGSGLRKWNVKFIPNDAKFGYVVSESTRITADNVADYPDKTYIYERCYTSEGTMYFRFAGTLAQIKDKLGIDEEDTTGASEEDSSVTEGDSDEGEHRRHVRDDSEVEEVASEEEVDIEGIESSS